MTIMGHSRDPLLNRLPATAIHPRYLSDDELQACLFERVQDRIGQRFLQLTLAEFAGQSAPPPEPAPTGAVTEGPPPAALLPSLWYRRWCVSTAKVTYARFDVLRSLKEEAAALLRVEARLAGQQTVRQVWHVEDPPPETPNGLRYFTTYAHVASEEGDHALSDS